MKNSARRRGSTQLAVAAVAETTKLVAHTQRTVTARATRPLRAVPPLAPVTTLVQTGIDATTAGVCATIQLVNAGVGRVLDRSFDLAERLAGRDEPDAVAHRPAGPLTKADHAEGILNGLYGDFLHARSNPLALAMTVRADGRAIALTPAALAQTYPVGTRRLAVFVHGLGCTEAIWRIGAADFHGAPGMTLGQHLQQTLGITPLFVRYNTGRSLEDNGRLLADLLTQVVHAYPPGVDELVLIGHSMGGLVGHHALRAGHATDAPWVPALRHVVCIGTPHCGAPAAQGTAWLTRTLGAVDTAATQVGAAVLNTRSAGIKDLRTGLAADVQPTLLPGVRYGFVGATYADVAPSALSQWLGDLVVPLASARHGCRPLEQVPSTVWTRTLAGVDHFHMANHPELHAAVGHALRATTP